MTKTLHIGETSAGKKFDLPLDAVTQTFGILAKRGVGKTYTASVLAEELLQAGLPVAIIDPLDVWWGLRAAADGERGGLPIVVLGGSHGDLPLEPGAGAIIADLVVEQGISTVLSLRHMSKNEQRRFVADFAERVYDRKGEDRYRQPLHIMIDEADAFVPQRVFSGQERMVGAIDDLVRRGRASGIGVTLITQRAAVINKDVLTQIEVLIALRTISPQDRKALEAWIEAHDAQSQRQEFMASLASLPIGTAWFWSPGWLDVFERVQVRRRKTFDSSATPKVGTKIQAPKQLADVDIAKLRERLAATIERAKQEDPRELRRQIAGLKKQLQEQPKTPQVETKIEHVEIPVLQDGQLAQIEQLIANMAGLGAQLAAIAQEIGTALAKVAAQPAAPNTAPARPPARPPAPAPAPRPAPDAPADQLSAPQQRTLTALAEFEAFGLHAVARSNVAIWSDQAPRSSAFTNNLGRLRTLGLIDYPEAGRVTLTEAGRARARASPALITSVEELHDAWYAKLPNPQARLLRALVDRYPEPIGRVALAEATGQSLTSSSFTNNLGALRSLGLLDYPQPGWVVATDLLFPTKE